MLESRIQKFVEESFAKVDVQINGTRPWDIQINNMNRCMRAVQKGTLGVGEAYMDGVWEAGNLDQFLTRVLSSSMDTQIGGIGVKLMNKVTQLPFFNPQSKDRAYQVAEAHYDLGNDLYEAMLDRRMVYTCGYWKNADNLDRAQVDKMDLVCKKIGLEKDMTVLDIGCGFGSFAKYAAEEYGAEVTGVSVSREQTAYAQELTKGLPVKYELKDYRDITGKYDRIVSIGMFEAVGRQNFGTFMDVAADHLESGGIFLLHTIGTNDSQANNDPWINKYIFPNGEIPSAARIAQAYEGKFVMEDWHNFGPDYDKTLMAWHKNFNDNWDELKQNGKYDDRFKKMWDFYLLSCAASFRARRNQLWQVVLTKDPVGEYQPVR